MYCFVVAWFRPRRCGHRQSGSSLSKTVTNAALYLNVQSAKEFALKLLGRPEERVAVALSFMYFVLLLAAYYAIRPVRDAFLVGLGTAEIKYLVAAVFFVMLAIAPLFGFLMAHVPRRKLLPAIYAFFVLNLIAFAIAFATPGLGAWPARLFYVWVTVFNMFVASVFWSFMADIWREEQGRRLFGFIAAGGSVGGLLGPTLAQSFAKGIGASGVTLLAALMLSGTVVCLLLLAKIAPNNAAQNTQSEKAFSGSSWQGVILVARSPFLLGIALLLVVGVVTAQFSYAETARLAKEAFDSPEARTMFFARLDFWTNVIALILQAGVVGALTTRFGIVAPLVGLAIIAFFAYGALALSPVLMTLGLSNIARRSAEFGVGKPARDMLYTVATPQEKYLAKNVIDTVVSRGGDVVGSWIYSVLTMLGVGLAGFGAISAATMIGATFIALAIAQGYRRRGGK